MKNQKLTLKDNIELIKKINKSPDYNAYFSNGKIVIEENFITIINPNDYKGVLN
jgi:hypothetical protein